MSAGWRGDGVGCDRSQAGAACWARGAPRAGVQRGRPGSSEPAGRFNTAPSPLDLSLAAPQHTPSVRGVNFRARARRARIRECKEISGAVHAEPGNPWTRPGHGEFHGRVRDWKLLETWFFKQCQF
ncbi:hypothetical protein Bbelb_267860 [Branchiostoma belcheri]|nr:hypothetical protein Bbelb_267860 [Branchiostoma belcheri]